MTPKNTSQALISISQRITQITLRYKRIIGDLSKNNLIIDELDKNPIRIVITKLEQLANEVDKMAVDELKKNN